jgi:hypothetical protein
LSRSVRVLELDDGVRLLLSIVSSSSLSNKLVVELIPGNAREGVGCSPMVDVDIGLMSVLCISGSER